MVMLQKKVDGFEGVHEGNRIGEQNLEARMLLEFCNQKDLCVVNIWFKKDKKKVTYGSGGKVLERCQGDLLGTAKQV